MELYFNYRTKVQEADLKIEKEKDVSCLIDNFVPS